MKKTFLGIFVIVGMALAATAHASVVTTVDNAQITPEPEAVFGLNYSGSTVGGPTFNRPLANGNSAPTALSGVGTATSYDVVQFSIAASGTYTFLSTSVLPANWDNYTVLYSGSFNPASPLTNALIANDDNPGIGKSGFNYNLATGVSYFFVTTGFGNTDAGSFNNTVTLAAVPEPGTWVMIGASFVGLAAVQRFRRTVG